MAKRQLSRDKNLIKGGFSHRMYALFYFLLIFVFLPKEGEISAVLCQEATRISCSLRAGDAGSDVASPGQQDRALVHPTTPALGADQGAAGGSPSHEHYARLW